MNEDITCSQVKARLESGVTFHFIDVREEWEHEEQNIGATLIPLGELPTRLSEIEHLKDEERSAPLRRVYEGLCSLGVDALISIGGDDTLKTANKFKMYQDLLPEDALRRWVRDLSGRGHQGRMVLSAGSVPVDRPGNLPSIFVELTPHATVTTEQMEEAVA